MRVPGGLAGVAAAVLAIGMAAIPPAWAADAGGGHAAVTTAATAAPATAPGTTLYVDFNGPCDNAGPGSQADPFCTAQEAADVVGPGQTVAIEAASPAGDPQSLSITRSGTVTEPITFEWTGTGPEPAIAPGKQTGKAAVTLQDVHDVTISDLAVRSVGTDDGIDVIGSSDIALTGLAVTHATPEPVGAITSEGIMIDGASSDVTVSKSEFEADNAEGAVLAKAGAQQVTLTTNRVYDSPDQSGFTLDGAADFAVTSNTLEIQCYGTSAGPTAIAIAHDSSGTVENNAIEPIAGSACPTPTVGLSVDASSAAGVTADYNAFFSEGPTSDYSWAGTAYQSPAAFAAATGEGTHDLTLTAAFAAAPPAGSAAINSANCSAPGELASDLIGNPWVSDPQAIDAGDGNGSCYASRGAYAPQDSMPITDTPPTTDASGYAAGTVPYSPGLTITGNATSGWGEPVSFTVNFGDGSAPVPASVGTPVTHTYSTAGEYTITITAADTSGSTARNTLTVYAMPDQAPAAGLSAAPVGLGTVNGILPDTAVFTASAGSTGWNIASTSINFGGTGMTEDAPAGANWEYIYAEPGTHTATVTVTDKLGRTSTASTAITVGDEPQDVYPSTVYDHSVAAHGTVKISAATLQDDCCSRAALIDVIVTGDLKAGFVIVYPDGTTRPNLSTVQFAAGQWAENSTLATGSTVDFYNGSAGAINLDVVTYGLDDIMNADGGYGTSGDTYAPVRPVTVLSRTEVAGGHQVAFPASGLAGVPADASDALLEVTEANATTAGRFETSCTSSWCSSFSVPGPYWSRGEQVTSLVMASTSGGARAIIKNLGTGSAYFTAYVVGYYVSEGSNAVYVPATPARLGTVFIGAKKSVTVAVRGRDGVPATGTTAADLDLTASEATAAGTLSVYADGTTQPVCVNVSYLRGSAVATRTVVAVGADGAIRLYNGGSSTVAVNVDLLGSYYAYS